MAYSPIEDKFLSALAAVQFPDAPVEQPAQEPMAAEPVQVAEVGATKMGDYGYSGQRQATMTDYDPTMRERMAEFLQAGFERFGMDRYKARQQAQTLIGGPSSNLPLNIGLADVVPFLGTTLQTEEAARMGGEAVTSAQQGMYGTAALQAGGAALGMVPGAAATIKAAKVLPKNLPVGMSTQAVGGMQGVLPSVKPTAPVNDMGFYSAVEQAALNIQRKSGTGQAMLNDITKGQDVKLDEVKWIGLDDFLKGKKNVTREEVQNFIAQNKVDVQEVTLGTNPTRWEGNALIVDNNPVGEIRDTSSGYAWRTPDGQYQLLGANRMFDAVEKVQQKLGVDVPEPSNPKFGQYTLPGGENYREILLTMPDNTDPQKARLAFEQRMKQKYGSFNTMKFTDAEKAESESTMQAILDNDGVVSKGQVFKSSHWDEANVLAHIRVNDRVDADGKKMLLVEEVQSDWHQAGRDKGYIASYKKEDVKPYTPEQAKSEFGLDNADLFWYFKVPDNTFQIPKSRFATQDEALNYVLTEKKINQYGVPDAPMKDTWYQLALKRVLKYAADNGYERVGLTTGSRQAERYDLSKQISKIYYSPPDSKQANKFGTVLKAFDKRGNEVINKSVTPDQLPDYIGKEVAKKLLESEGNSMGVKALDGVDLSVGGEGMKKYYDEVYPQFLAKYGKKWGAKVGETYLPIYDGKTQKAGAEPIRYVDITPEMREGVGKGQPLFTATGVGAGTAGATMQDKEQK